MTLHDDRTGGLRALLDQDAFHARHLGTTPAREAAMLAAIGRDSREALIRDTVPAAIRLDAPLALPAPVTEAEALADAPQTVNEAPFADGWLFTMRVADPSQVSALLSAADYTAGAGAA